ncbi:MAG TPA: 3'-5' exonuclease, partial [Acidimicrobiales bacterium]
VVAGVEALRELYEQRRWLGPSEMLEKVVRDRKVMVLAFGQRRYRDVWRRVRFLLDQARQFADTRAGSLRDFLAWADLQSADAARVHEPVVPEHDDDSVRIMTIHGAKGLEFPITIVSGLTTRMSGGRRGVKILWDGDDPHISLSKNAASDHFDRLADVESEMDSHERLRLLYVALTRARDHLVVSTFHAAGKCSFGEIVHQQSQRLPESLCRFIDVPEAPPTSQVAVPTGEPGVEHSDESRAAWAEAHRALLERGGRSRTVSPTALARTAEPNWHDDGVGDFESETESVASIAGVRRRGRAGTAVGKAVHAVLQTVDLATGAGIDDVARTHAQVEDVPHLAGTVARLARAALGAPIVRVAAANRHWRELYVATPTGGRLLEGYVDLLVEDPERGGLVVVDFKTDSVRTGADIDEAMLKYRRQGAAYALAVQRTTGMPVAGCCFLFLSGDRAVERWVDDLAGAVVEIEAAIAAGA